MKIFNILPPSFTSRTAHVSKEEAVGGMLGAVGGFGSGLILFGPLGGVIGLLLCSILFSTLGHHWSNLDK